MGSFPFFVVAQHQTTKSGQASCLFFFGFIKKIKMLKT